MKFVEHNGNFQIAPDDVVSYEALPAGYYKISYDKEHDIFSLDRTYEFSINESNIYGVQKEKLKKVELAYKFANKSLGILLSGDKGIGKTLFAKLLCMSMYANGKAIIIVDKSYKGLDKFISDIPGDVVFLFDEFGKIFEKSNSSDGRDETDQESLLTVFDGTSPHKRLFIVTCNDLDEIDKCFLNRTGRFHYHFVFEYPSGEDIQQYMKDNLQNYDESEVQKVIKLSRKIKINYDTLRSICFEMNMGSKYDDFIYDLNIKSKEEGLKYKAIVRAKDGNILTLYTDDKSSDNCSIYDMGKITMGLSTNPYYYSGDYKISFDTKDMIIEKGIIILKSGNYIFEDYNDNPINTDITKDIIMEPYNPYSALISKSVFI